MLFKAKSKYIRVSPYKLRPYVAVIRGNTIDRALAWLKTHRIKRIRPLEKVVFSAYSNAKNLQKNISMENVYIKEIRVDQGPVVKYFKPSAMGRASMQRKRLSHLEVVLEQR